MQRRHFLAALAGPALTGLLAACGGAVTPTTAPKTEAPKTEAPKAVAPPTSAPTAAPAATTAPAAAPTSAPKPAEPKPAESKPAESKPAATTGKPGAIPAIEFDPSLQWFNTKALTLADLKGKASLLVFWSDI